MNLLSVLASDQSWWQAHVALPRIVRQYIDEPTCGVEVGVAFGSMSIWLTRRIPDLHMLCVDPFIPYDPADGMSSFMEHSGDEIENLVRWRFANEQHGRLQLMRMTSEQAAATIPDGSQDFVFIDADHRYDAVRSDIAIWRPKVRAGGLISGHDFDPRWPGVIQAVNESIGKANVTIHQPSSVWFARVT